MGSTLAVFGIVEEAHTSKINIVVTLPGNGPNEVYGRAMHYPQLPYGLSAAELGSHSSWCWMWMG